MRTFRDALIVLACLVIAWGLLGITDPVPGSGGGEGPPTPVVKVVNTAEEPVPTTVEGGVLNATVTGGVSVDNFPGIQQVDGSVSVVNLPVVQEVTGVVTVSNVPTADSGREPVSAGGSGLVASGEVATVVTVFTVPADKRLVIEYVSLIAIGAVPQETIEVSITLGGPKVEAHFHPSPVGSVGTANVPRQAVNQAVRLYLGPGKPAEFFVLRTPGQQTAVDVRAFISGYLVDM